VDLRRQAQFGSAAPWGETNWRARNGRGSNQGPGGLLHTKWIKLEYRLQDPEGMADSGRDEAPRKPMTARQRGSTVEGVMEGCATMQRVPNA